MKRLTLIGSIVTVVLVWSSLFAPALAQESGEDCSRDGVDDKCEAWVATFDDNEIAQIAAESPADIVVSPDGNFVYSATRTTVGSGFDAKTRWTILAYTSHGRLAWLSRWGDADKHSFPTSITVSPDGDLVFVSGSWRNDQVSPDGHLTTIAFDAHDGSIVWVANYDGPAGGTDNARDLILSPDGRTLYIAGISAGRDNADLDYAVIAYDALTGAERWVTRWDGIGNGNTDSPFAIDLNSRGDLLYLTGWSYGRGEFNNDYGTIAVDTAGNDAGRIVWTARYDGVGVHAPDQAADLVVSPDDRTVFVTGMSDDVEGGPPFDVNYDYATVAYDALTGQLLWETRKKWGASTFNSPNALTIDPLGRRLIVTGQVGQRQLDFGTVAYDPRTGQESWADQYGFVEHDLELGREITMDPRGETVYVSGVSAKSPPGVPGVVVYAPNADQLTMAYDVLSGEKKWLARFNPASTDFVSVQASAVSPDATMLYTGAAIDDQNWDNDRDDNDAGVVAYDLGGGIPVPAPPSTLEFADSTDTAGQYSDQTTVRTRLTDPSGDPVANRQLTLSFQDETSSAVTNAQGLAEFTTALTGAPGDHPVEVSFVGDSTYGSASTESVYSIEKENSSLSLGANPKRKRLRAALTDGDSPEGISGRQIRFYFRKQLLGRAPTNEAGVAVLNGVEETSKPMRHFKAVFAGDNWYRSARTP